MYSIVQFEDGVLAIPSSWLNKNGKNSLYPPPEKYDVNREIINNTSPKEDWISYSVIRTFGTADNYETAKEKQQLACDTSDFDEDALLKSRRRRKKQKCSTSFDENECKENNKKSHNNNNSDLNSKQSKKFKKSRKEILSSTSSEDDNSQNKLPTKSSLGKDLYKRPPNNSLLSLTENESNINPEHNITNTQRQVRTLQNVHQTDSNELNISKSAKNLSEIIMKDCSSMTTDEKLKYLITLQEVNVKKSNHIFLELNTLKKNLEKSNDQQSTAVRNDDKLEDKVKKVNRFFPLKENTDLIQLEKALQNEQMKNNTVEVLSRRGGKEYTDLTNNIMFKILTNEFAENYSYKGRQKKKCFADTIISKCVIEAVTSMFESTDESKVENKIGMWLANAPTRLKRCAEKKTADRAERDNDNNNDEPQ